MSTPPATIRPNAPKARVLVVDDEAAVRELICRWLRDSGYICVAADSVARARECLRDYSVDLATIDIRMPGCTGMELLKDLADRHPDVAAIMLTGSNDTQSAVEALTQGAWDYLVKPARREELLIQVKKALERRQLLIERRQYTARLESRVREQTEVIRHAHEETIHRLVTASMYRDGETGAHIRRTGACAEVVAKAAGWPAEQAELIRMAAPMHDLGKIAIPDAVLHKPGALTVGERQVMQTHTMLGAQMLGDSESPHLEMGRQIALSHHERWDGQGYPHGLRGTAIPECARIVALVDVYDALTHDRVYRPALASEEALGIMLDGEGTHFDPVLLEHMLSVLPAIRQVLEDMPDEDGATGLPDGYGESISYRAPLADLTCNA